MASDVTPTSTKPPTATGPIRPEGSGVESYSRWLRKNTANTSTGVVKYSATQSQNARWSCRNRSQWRTVVTPISAANVPTGTNPPATVCHCVAPTTRTKKYAPPIYTDPSTMADIEGMICQANSRFVSVGQGTRTTNAKTRNGTMTAASTRVAGSTRSLLVRSTSTTQAPLCSEILLSTRDSAYTSARSRRAIASPVIARVRRFTSCPWL